MNNTVSFTCLLYSEVNGKGWLLALTYMTVVISYSLPIFIFVAFCYACFWRDTHTIYVLCALMFNALWCITIKELTRVDRPRQWCSAVQYIGHSMPSLYASVVVFITTYYSYQFWKHARDVWTTKTLVLRLLSAGCYAVLVTYSRVFLVLARLEDILVGGIIGSSTTVAFLFILSKQRFTSYKSSLKAD